MLWFCLIGVNCLVGSFNCWLLCFVLLWILFVDLLFWFDFLVWRFVGVVGLLRALVDLYWYLV